MMLKKDLIHQIMKLSTGKNKKVIGLMKDELGGRVITEFVALRPKTYSYLTDDCKEDKKAKGTKCVIKRMIKFNDYKNCLLTFYYPNYEDKVRKISNLVCKYH